MLLGFSIFAFANLGIDKLFASFFISMNKEAINRSANRLEIAQGDSILLNTVHESNVFFDYCFYQYRMDHLNIIQHSFQQSLNSYEPEMLKIFEIVSKGTFAYITSTVFKHLILVTDLAMVYRKRLVNPL